MIHSDKPESTRSSGKQIEIQIGDEVFVARAVVHLIYRKAVELGLGVETSEISSFFVNP